VRKESEGIHQRNHNPTGSLLCYFDPNASDDIPTNNSSWKDHPMLDFIRSCRPLSKLGVFIPLVNDVVPMIVVASENTTSPCLARILYNTDLERVRFHPELQTIQLDLSLSHGHKQERLHAAEQLIETCPLMNTICFVQCDSLPKHRCTFWGASAKSKHRK
jgi:hypothetical protein